MALRRVPAGQPAASDAVLRRPQPVPRPDQHRRDEANGPPLTCHELPRPLSTTSLASSHAQGRGDGSASPHAPSDVSCARNQTSISGPPSGRALAWISVPWEPAMARSIERPRPHPSPWTVRSVAARRNGSKRRSPSDGGPEAGSWQRTRFSPPERVGQPPPRGSGRSARRGRSWGQVRVYLPHGGLTSLPSGEAAPGPTLGHVGSIGAASPLPRHSDRGIGCRHRRSRTTHRASGPVPPAAIGSRGDRNRPTCGGSSPASPPGLTRTANAVGQAEEVGQAGPRAAP